MMRRRAAVCAMDLIHGRGFLGVGLSHKSGILSPPFSIFSSNFSSDRAFPTKRPSIDFDAVKKLDDAIQLFQNMKSMQPQPCVKMYTSFLSVMVKIEQYSFALDVFVEMLRMRVPIDVYLMTIAVNCCGLLKDVNSGFALIGFFFKRGCEPNAVTVSTLIKGLFLEDKVADAVKLFEKVVGLKLCEPNDFMILHMMDGLCKAGQVVVAHDWLLRLESCGWRPNVYAYNALVDGLCKCGMVDGVLLVLSKMIRKGIKPNIVTYNSMINGLCMNGEIDEALSLMRTMEVEGFAPDIVTYGSLIDGLCKNGKRDVAIDVLSQLPSKGLQPNVQMYTMIIDSLCQEGYLEVVKQLLVEMENHGCGPDRVTYLVIIKCLLKKNELHQANSFMEEMHEKGFHTYSSAPTHQDSVDDFFLKLMKDLAPTL